MKPRLACTSRKIEAILLLTTAKMWLLKHIETFARKREMKLWIDDLRPAPDGYIWCKSVNEAIDAIITATHTYHSGNEKFRIELIDLDHDAGDFMKDGGDYIAVLDYLVADKETLKLNEMGTLFRIHSMNPVGRQNMQRIIERNGWKLIK